LFFGHRKYLKRATIYLADQAVLSLFATAMILLIALSAPLNAAVSSNSVAGPARYPLVRCIPKVKVPTEICLIELTGVQVTGVLIPNTTINEESISEMDPFIGSGGTWNHPIAARKISPIWEFGLIKLVRKRRIRLASFVSWNRNIPKVRLQRSWNINPIDFKISIGAKRWTLAVVLSRHTQIEREVRENWNIWNGAHQWFNANVVGIFDRDLCSDLNPWAFRKSEIFHRTSSPVRLATGISRVEYQDNQANPRKADSGLVIGIAFFVAAVLMTCTGLWRAFFVASRYDGTSRALWELYIGLFLIFLAQVLGPIGLWLVSGIPVLGF